MVFGGLAEATRKLRGKGQKKGVLNGNMGAKKGENRENGEGKGGFWAVEKGKT